MLSNVVVTITTIVVIVTIVCVNIICRILCCVVLSSSFKQSAGKRKEPACTKTVRTPSQEQMPPPLTAPLAKKARTSTKGYTTHIYMYSWIVCYSQHVKMTKYY